jgi:hypothetical protein
MTIVRKKENSTGWKEILMSELFNSHREQEIQGNSGLPIIELYVAWM